ncbi:MAG: uroporphyrinogen-III synthase [Nitrosomonadales bacterium]|nr:MAG: uroporphyrinogen-III synthase [Nitrosomonadales bacterium]
MPDLPLAGRGIAITRPAAQAQALAALIRAQGGNPILFPLLEILPLQDYTDFEHAIACLNQCDWAIFISANAVEYGVPRVLARGVWPARVRCAGIGPTTAAALGDFGITQVLTPPQRFDSEGLLALPEMQGMAGKRVVIFRGTGGRDLIAKTLRARGAEVIFAECYRRHNPQTDAGDLSRLWQNKQLQAIIVTSSEVLRNLLDLASDGKEAGCADWLRATPLYVSHPRIGELAREHGLQAHMASGPGDEAMLQCLLDQAS